MTDVSASVAAVLEAGFVFWGLFLACVLLVAAYVAWMLWAERREGRGATGPAGGPEPGDGGRP